MSVKGVKAEWGAAHGRPSGTTTTTEDSSHVTSNSVELEKQRGNKATKGAHTGFEPGRYLKIPAEIEHFPR